jgi:hypothetical protein
LEKLESSAAVQGGLQLVCHFAEGLVVFVFGKAQDSCAKRFSIIRGGEGTIIYEDEVIEHEIRDFVRLGTEEGVNADFEARLGIFGVRDRMSQFAVEQRLGVIHDFARITDGGTIVKHRGQFGEADVRAITRADFFGFALDMRVEGLFEIVGS